jgi:hypothetical protein
VAEPPIAEPAPHLAERPVERELEPPLRDAGQRDFAATPHRDDFAAPVERNNDAWSPPEPPSEPRGTGEPERVSRPAEHEPAPQGADERQTG